MVDKIVFDDPFYPVPSEVLDADPARALRDLLARVSSLEGAQQAQQRQAVDEMRQAMIELLGLYDALTGIIERHGVATNAPDAVMVRALIALGRQMLALLRSHRVEPISTIGKTVDAATSDVAGSELRDNVRPGVVLRETRIGYAWPHGVLRRAEVVVSARPETASRAARDEAGDARGAAPSEEQTERRG